MIALALVLAGYSIVAASVLALTHFSDMNYREERSSRVMGLFLLLALSALQLAHFAWLYLGLDWVTGPAYRIALFGVAPAFYLFSQPLLRPGAPAPTIQRIWHALPIVLGVALADPLALPVAFAVGAAYLAWLGHSLFALRQERANFQGEILLLGGVFVVALAAGVLGIFASALPGKLFHAMYASSIGIALFLVQVTLARRPDLATDVSAAAHASYATSTLQRIDCEATLARLRDLMTSSKAYEDPELSLASLAKLLNLSSHQLSELLNVRLGKGFSRYLREQRVNAAKTMLRDEPLASVLSVGLSVGFTSQSNFYEAFREIEGSTPGQYRKLHSGTKTRTDLLTGPHAPD